MSSTLAKIEKRMRRRIRKIWTETQLRSRGKLANWLALSDAQREYIIDRMQRRGFSTRLTPEEASALLAEARTLEALRTQPRKVDFESDWGATTWIVDGTDQHGNRVSEVVYGGASMTLFSEVDSITVPGAAYIPANAVGKFNPPQPATLQWKPLPKP